MLDLAPGADMAQIKTSYRQLIRKYHPDMHAGNPQKHPTVMDHNARSIGIEMYQVDPAVTRKAGGTPDFTDWQYDTVVQLVYDICYRRKIKRSMVVAHGTINPIDRADPQGFDWDRFRKALWFLSFRMGGAMGSQYFLLD